MSASILLSLIAGLLLIGFLFWVFIRFSKNNNSDTKENQNFYGNFKISENSNFTHKRNHHRTVKNIPVEIQTEINQENSLTGETKDISLMGAFIVSQLKIKADDKIKIRFKTIKTENSDWVDAKVIWSNTYMPSRKLILPGFGIKFINVTQKEKNLLKTLVEHA
ncbi:MAG: PilZ domain-containing protein [Thermodesulfobacteriota bacterium]